MTPVRSPRLSPELLGHLLGILGLVAVWEVAAMKSSGLSISGPWTTFRALLDLLGDSQFLKTHLLPTWACAWAALSAAFVIGTALGLFTGRSRLFRAMLKPLQWMTLSVPAVVFVVLGMLWLGLGPRMVLVVTFVLLVPVSYVTSADAMRALSGDLWEVASLYRLSSWMRVRYLYLPALRGTLAAGLVLLSGNSVRVTVLCEVMASDAGLGYELTAARARLDTPRLFGLCLLCVLVVGATERILHPWVRRLVRDA